MKILVLGDVVGSSGRDALKKHLSQIISKNKIDFSIVNGENSSDDGKGITKKKSEQDASHNALIKYGVIN